MEIVGVSLARGSATVDPPMALPPDRPNAASRTRCVALVSARTSTNALTGHSGGGVGRSYGAKDMGRRFGLRALSEAVAKVHYRGLDLSHLQV